jgi:hypothetical protein
MKVLVVRDAFGDHAVGEMIRDPDAMKAIVEAGQAHFCTPADVDESFFAEDPSDATGKRRGAAA